MKRINSKMVQRMVLVWFVSLVTLLLPHWGLAVAFDPIMHQPAFLIVVPVLLAFVPLFIPAKDTVNDDTLISRRANHLGSRSGAWARLVLGIGVLCLVLIMDIAANSDWTPGGGRSIVKMNIGLLILLALPLTSIGFCVKRLREPD
jgi:hypothetical protein